MSGQWIDTHFDSFDGSKTIIHFFFMGFLIFLKANHFISEKLMISENPLYAMMFLAVLICILMFIVHFIPRRFPMFDAETIEKLNKYEFYLK